MHAFDRQTDRRTDGRTDRIPIAIPRLHSMQRGKNLRKLFPKKNYFPIPSPANWHRFCPQTALCCLQDRAGKLGF